MSNPFRRAEATGLRLRMALVGPAGSGKTMWGLKLATALADGTVPAVLDSEHGSSAKYAREHAFDMVPMTHFAPDRYVKGIALAEEHGYGVLLIDSLSHAWAGIDGALAMVDKAAAGSRSGNSYTAWRDVTPLHNAMVEALLAAKLHLIVTMRTKVEYVLETNDRGKQAPRKIGLAPIQREGLDYEFDVVADVDLDHRLTIGKTRCAALDKQVFDPEDLDTLVGILREWLGDAATVRDAPRPEPAPAPAVEDPFVPDEAPLGSTAGRTPQLLSDALEEELALCATFEHVHSSVTTYREAKRNGELTGSALRAVETAIAAAYARVGAATGHSDRAAVAKVCASYTGAKDRRELDEATALRDRMVVAGRLRNAEDSSAWQSVEKVRQEAVKRLAVPAGDPSFTTDDDDPFA